MSAAQWTAEVTIDPATGEASLSLGAYDALGRPVEVSEEDLAKFRALALAAALEPPGLARNRRARERWNAWMELEGDRTLWRNMSQIEREDWWTNDA
jgi:hypothetical protein